MTTEINKKKPEFEYVLITAVKNEGDHIERTIKSIICQSKLPLKWVIVSDDSTDNTDEIVRSYEKKYKFIEFVRRYGENKNKDQSANFASKICAFNMGYALLKHSKYQLIGNLDGDMSFGSTYYERIIDEFYKDPLLGVASGLIFDAFDGRIQPHCASNAGYVPGALQMFRRKCYEDIGGYIAVRQGGEDTIASYTARMKGWNVKIFNELEAFHHKKGRSQRGLIKECFREGTMFYLLGSHPIVEIGKSLCRLFAKPYCIGSMIRICGFIWPLFRGSERPVSDKFVRHMRHYQMQRIMSFFSRSA
jgi:biofilm PGA synthesis N-glycosyltransferase PgaC